MAKNGTNLSYSSATLSSAVDMVAKQTCFLQLYLFCLTDITNFRSLQESVVWSLADQTIWPARREFPTESLPLILSIYGDMHALFIYAAASAGISLGRPLQQCEPIPRPKLFVPRPHPLTASAESVRRMGTTRWLGWDKLNARSC